ncbi:MAG: YqiA/YcfP family alpha/beta fold hydrolase [Candidatus Thiodiazotropha sp.]
MIVYLHGLNSAGTSGKAAVLRERLAPVEIYSPTYPAQSAALAVETLGQALGQLLQASLSTEPRLLVGSSMGGFYGAWLARHLGFQHLVMINPALRPWELLRQVVGWQYNEAQDERYYLSAEMVAATQDYATAPDGIGSPLTLLLDEGDELIDSRQTAADCRGLAEVHLFEGGSHGFEHMDEAVGIIGGIHRSLARDMSANKHQ